MESTSLALKTTTPSRFLFDPHNPTASHHRFRSQSLNIGRKHQRPASICALRKSEHDVVIVGGGIIGLSIARHLLLHSDLSVAVVDKSFPCSGATGAGQGYIWMAHLTPGSDTWELSMRSKRLWEELAESLELQGLNPSDELGWKRTGSLLIGRATEELKMLEKRTMLLSEAGLRAEYLSANSLQCKEPALEVVGEFGAQFLPDDCQLDASKTVAFIEKGNKQFASEGRYTEFYNNPVTNLIRSERNGAVEGIETAQEILFSKQAVVIAAGAWTGSLMQNLAAKADIITPLVPVKPRKGHLLVLENFNKIQLNHGLMEAGYIGHKFANSPSNVDDQMQLTSISMTATIDTMGNLLLGSSRQFTGFCREVDDSIIKLIWERAGQFFPAIRSSPLNLNQIRIGHRPYMPDGKPVIGPFPGLPNVLLAAGHEGSGLCMALGTAEMVSDVILNNPGKVNCTPFSMQGRFAS